MIARIWHGRVPAAKGESYLEHMRTFAIPRYRAVPGNLAAWWLRCQQQLAMTQLAGATAQASPRPPSI